MGFATRSSPFKRGGSASLNTPQVWNRIGVNVVMSDTSSRGQFQIEFNDGAQVFNAGDGIVIPGGPEHRHKATASSAIVRAIFVEDA